MASWYAEEGAEACLRCPSIVTDDVFRALEVSVAADPATPVPEEDHGA